MRLLSPILNDTDTIDLGTTRTLVTNAANTIMWPHARYAFQEPLDARYTSNNTLTANSYGYLTYPVGTSNYGAAVGDRVVVTNQVPKSRNGIYVVSKAGSTQAVWELKRAADAAKVAQFYTYKPIYVTLLDQMYMLVSPTPKAMTNDFDFQPYTYTNLEPGSYGDGSRFDADCDYEFAGFSLTPYTPLNDNYVYLTGRFTAPKDFTEGDVIRLHDMDYELRTPDGKTPTNKVFVLGSLVEVHLDSTRFIAFLSYNDQYATTLVESSNRFNIFYGERPSASTLGMYVPGIAEPERVIVNPNIVVSSTASAYPDNTLLVLHGRSPGNVTPIGTAGKTSIIISVDAVYHTQSGVDVPLGNVEINENGIWKPLV